MRHPTKQWLTACALLLATLTGAKPSSGQIVAQIGEITLTLEEFEDRARELRASGYDHLTTIDLEAKRQLLDGIIAQELLVLEGLRRGIADDPVIGADLARYERRGLMNALYDTQALSGDYSSTEEELRAYFVDQKFDIEVMTQHIVCATEAEAWAVLRGLEAGTSFETLLDEYTLPDVKTRFGPSGFVGWFRVGSLYPELIEPMMQVAVGEHYPEPVKTDRGYHVFRLVERRQVSFESSIEFLREKLRIQKRANDMEAYVNGLRQRYEIRIDSLGLQRLAGVKAGNDSYTGPEVLVTWRGGQLTVSDYMGIVRQGRARHPAREDRESLIRSVDNHAGQHVMMAEARRLGLDRQPAVVRKARNRRRELFTKWLFQTETKRRAVVDTSEANVRRFYESNLDLYTKSDGEVSPLEVVASSIRSSMVRHAKDTAMDEFLTELRERYADEIQIDMQVLEQALPDGIEIPEKAP